MKATIFYSDGHGREVLHYDGVKSVDFNKKYDDCTIVLHDNYECWMMIHDKEHKPQNYRSDDAGKKFLQAHNISTRPFVHVFTNVFEVICED